MVNRLIKLSKTNSFFVFGARGVGKSTLIQSLHAKDSKVVTFNLLDLKVEDDLRTTPRSLLEIVRAQKPDWVVIDEIQKLPKLLDLVHLMIEEDKQKFILTGSSARKLKRGAGNLLAGRAFVYHLHPFTSVELGDEFNLMKALNWGLMPKIRSLETEEEMQDFLEAYCRTYLKEEIQQEQIVRNLDPFRQFLEIAAQMNGKIINFSKIAREVGVDTTTVQNYFSILEDTLLGFFLPSYHHSIRKRQINAPKFYFFDMGVVKALTRTLDIPLKKQSSLFGFYFEHFLILEIKKLSDYRKKQWDMSYLNTKDDNEIDLLLTQQGQPTYCIEIKSSEKITEENLKNFINLTKDIKNSKAYCFSCDPQEKLIGHVRCMPWQMGLRELGLVK